MSHNDENNRVRFKRFSPYRIIEHQLNLVVFFALVATGLVQKFHDASLSQWLVQLLGGIDNVRLVHRVAGFTFSFTLVQHIAVAIYVLLFRHARPSIVINAKDFSDVVQNLRYYFGLSQRPARCDRFDYRQKFEYWGVIMGGVLMIVTGFMLWFPVEVFRLVPFLPGQVLPAAKVAHSSEALMAFLIIVTWHIYDSIFSPEVFPLDTSIFTGKISKKRLMHEHPLEYERLTGSKIIEGA